MITLENGNIQGPNGLMVPYGSMTMQLNVDATVIAVPGGFVGAALEIVFQFDATGNLVQPALIWSNAELNPQNENGLGTYYLVTFYDANGARINSTPMWWQFPEAANSTVDISQIVPISTVGGNVIFYPTDFAITPPGPSKLGGVFSNAGISGEFVSAINTDGSVTLSVIPIGGVSGNIQYNSAGVLGGSNNLAWTGSSLNIAGSISVTGSGTLQLDGAITEYNGIATVANGVPAEFAAVNLTAQTAAISTTTLYTTVAGGQYRLSWNAKVTTAAGSSSTLGALTITYVDPDGVTQTITCAAQIAAGTIATTSTGNSTTTVLLGVPLLLNCKAASVVSYAFAYASNASNAMAYNLNLQLESL